MTTNVIMVTNVIKYDLQKCTMLIKYRSQRVRQPFVAI